MKGSTIRFALATFLLAFTAVSFAASKNDEVWFKGTTVDAIERNLAVALRTPSPGVQASASQVIRDFRAMLPDQDFARLIIPLMAIVKDEDTSVPVRMVAALALHELNSERGDFTIQRTAQFTKNERLKHLCTWLTYERTQRSSTGLQTKAVVDK